MIDRAEFEDLIDEAGVVVAGHGDPDAVMVQRDKIIDLFGMLEVLDHPMAVYGALCALVLVSGMVADSTEHEFIDADTAAGIGGNLAAFVVALRPYLPKESEWP